MELQYKVSVESAEEKITEDAAKYSDSPHFYLTVKDDGEGVYLDGGELNADDINASRFIYEGRVSAGPYQIKKVDTGTLQAELVINPN